MMKQQQVDHTIEEILHQKGLFAIHFIVYLFCSVLEPHSALSVGVLFVRHALFTVD